MSSAVEGTQGLSKASPAALQAADKDLSEILLRHRSEAIAISEGKSNGLDIGTSVDTALASLLQYMEGVRIDELERAVQQFIFTTRSNPHNFSEYATYRLSELKRMNEGTGLAHDKHDVRTEDKLN